MGNTFSSTNKILKYIRVFGDSISLFSCSGTNFNPLCRQILTWYPTGVPHGVCIERWSNLPYVSEVSDVYLWLLHVHQYTYALA